MSAANGENPYGSRLFPRHAAKLAASAVSVCAAAERGYRTNDTKSALRGLGFGAAQARPPALVVPLFDVWGKNAGFQCRPDEPRVVKGRVVKYETVKGQPMVLDVPPHSRPDLGNPHVPLIITEGPIKADALVSAGACAVALLGVWSWRGTNADGGTVALADWEAVALNDRQVLIAFDSDVTTKLQVHQAMARLAGLLKRRGAHVFYAYIPAGDLGVKCGVDDWLAAGHNIDDLWKRATEKLEAPAEQQDTPRSYEPPNKMALAAVDDVFARWLEHMDPGALHAVLATVVANRAAGDPVWLLVVAPPSSGKTEIIMPLSALPDTTLTGRMTVGSLLSGTSGKERAPDATGGLLRQVGARGILVCKDFGALLSMPRDARAEVLQAMRDIFDGRYDRAIGTDGGRTLTWSGHCGFVAGTTEAIDSHHAVVAALGDRFICIRLELADGERQAQHAIAGGGVEEEMRAELGDAVAGLLGHLGVVLAPLRPDDRTRIAKLAALAVRCRSVVERDSYHREVVNVPTPEQPARIAKQLAKLAAGLRHIGCTETETWTVITRVALDSMPAGRRKVLDQLAAQDEVSTAAVGEAIRLPTQTARRHLEDLAAHGISRRLDIGLGTADLWSMSPWARDRWPANAFPEMSVSVHCRGGNDDEDGTFPETLGPVHDTSTPPTGDSSRPRVST